jgi:prepilin-type N-terminal cleavage/methylation domain-containing protein
MRRADGRRAAPAGFTLAELLVALALLAVLTMVLFGALTTHVRLARQLAQRVLEHDAVRTASTVLGGELRRVAPADVRGVGGDSLALRAFRGIATACAASADGVVVHFRGDRMPEPLKDSVLWLGSAAAPAGAALVDVESFATARCTGVAAGNVQFWRTDPPLPEHGVLLLFESGTYFLAGGALRYRIGAAGRQPLTAELFLHPAPGFASRGPAALEYRLVLAGSARFPIISAVHFPVRSARPR